MSYGELAKTDWQNIITIRPGPVLHVWKGGAEFCAVPLTHRAALNIIGSLTAAMQVSDAMPTATPNEGLAFSDHLSRRDAERAQFEGVKG